MKKLILITVLSATMAAHATKSEDEVVAAVLILEAGGEQRRGMEAVLEVIHTRAQQMRRTHYQVVTRPRQFSVLNGTTPQALVAKARKHPHWTLALRLAISPVRTNWTNGANHYHEKSVNPGWPNRVAKVGRHLFYRFS